MSVSVSFYLHRQPYSSVIDANLQGAHSGSDRTMLAVAYGLCSLGCKVTIFSSAIITNQYGSLPNEGSEGVQFRIAADLWGAIALNDSNGGGPLVFAIKNEEEQISTLEKCNVSATHLYAWAHNSPGREWITRVAIPRKVSDIVFVSLGQRANYAHHGIRARTHTVQNFIPITMEPINAAYFPQLNPATISFVGALVPEKGLHHLAAAWHELRTRIPSLRLNVYGGFAAHQGRTESGGSENTYLAKLLSILQVNDAGDLRAIGIELFGSVKQAQLSRGLSHSLCTVVNPSVAGSLETFCLSAVESLLLGVPVVGARAGALPETVGHMVGGLLHRNNAEMIVNICNLYQDIELRRQLSLKGRQRVLSRYRETPALTRWHDLISGRPITDRPYVDEAAFPPHYYARRALGVIKRCVREFWQPHVDENR